MDKKIKNKLFLLCTVLLSISSCIEDKNLYEGDSDDDNPDNPTYEYSSYSYPFGKENLKSTVEIIIHTTKLIEPDEIKAVIPPLKYNKSLLLMLTQDDCKHAAYCRTWAAINGRPVSSSNLYPAVHNPQELYYDAAQLQAGDLPPTIIPAGKTLGSTDGNGNEVRFAITTTLAPEEEWMNDETIVNPGFSENYYRFYMKSGLIWDNIVEMLNYGTGIAFHDVKAPDVNNSSEILQHYGIAQNIILENLDDRGCKMLAEPNGNKTYVTAALQYPDIQTMTAQTGTVKLYPFKVTNDLRGSLLHRTFNEEPDYFKEMILKELELQKEDREAIHIGVHGTDNKWVQFLEWLNTNYGKDGDDSIWFPSQEEYYEYNYYRTHTPIHIENLDPNTIKVTLELSGEKYFYYPSITVNLSGINENDIISISTNDAITGFSYGDYGNGIMMNIDCRKFLVEHATHYVELYEKDKSSQMHKSDALYFVNMLKESDKKTELINRIN